ncbi:MAG: succinate dehydrogenase assembly factor 2 [Sphingomonadaceae bacterium]
MQETAAPHKDISRIARIRFRAWHRGTREADFMIGSFFDRFHADWGGDELDWFEALLEEEDVDVIAWVFATAEVPERFAGPMMDQMRKLDYVNIPR